MIFDFILCLLSDLILIYNSNTERKKMNNEDDEEVNIIDRNEHTQTQTNANGI